ncbi:hypothetical protein [Actinomadura bangladeshensis]|uniref:Uncharacterized protein n=1 Tax=Actinomadura bangladeshensis TaxID=453573 RepID=A0A4R4MVE7_9ACTN|nr:hypothetical protein [Actinomadura bangladeshensis]TDC00179.1 hypothetical protein E1284_40845 [Actinomadura bangladeshensis]
MVPTPRAIQLREEVRALLEHAGTVLAPALRQSTWLHRRVAAVVPSHTAALFMARTTDLVCLTLDGWLPDAIAAVRGGCGSPR